MRIHTSTISYTGTLRKILAAAIDVGKVAPDVDFVVGPEPHGSRKRALAFEVQLGTHNSSSGPTRSRHYKNSGVNGAGNCYAASYDEWGWFLAALFEVDPDAIAGPYDGLDDFNTKTRDAYNAEHELFVNQNATHRSLASGAQ